MRFPEFDGEWDIYRISDLLEFFTTNSLSWEQLKYDTENIRNLHYGLIHKGAPTQINTDTFQLPSICEGFIPKTHTLCKDGDVAFADASEDTNGVAKAVEFFNCNDKKIVCGLHTIHGRDKLNVTVKGFKGYAFSSFSFRNQIKQLAQGTKVYSVSQKSFNECFVSVPSQKEQTKIANLMQIIDDRISTQSQLIEDL
ncbi:MAG: restriction endonuclease subunit S, partial [Bacteroidales bacterium]|nr:restriction endonuclease subunit S [Bacteroidales bacterium]